MMAMSTTALGGRLSLAVKTEFDDSQVSASMTEPESILFFSTRVIWDNIMDELILKLKQQIIEELSLDEVSPEDIDSEEPLFGDGLDLDSIDALSLVVVLDKTYGVKIVDPEQGKEILYSVKTIAEYIIASR